MDNIRCGYPRKKVVPFSPYTEIVVEVDINTDMLVLEQFFYIRSWDFANSVTIDWGDGETTTYTFNALDGNSPDIIIPLEIDSDSPFPTAVDIRHTYANTGRYIVRLISTSSLASVGVSPADENMWERAREAFDEFCGEEEGPCYEYDYSMDDFVRTALVGIIKYDSNTIILMDDTFRYAPLEYIDAPLNHDNVPQVMSWVSTFQTMHSTDVRFVSNFMSDVRSAVEFSYVFAYWRNFDGRFPVAFLDNLSQDIRTLAGLFQYMHSYTGPLPHIDVSNNSVLELCEYMCYYNENMAGNGLSFINQKPRDFWGYAYEGAVPGVRRFIGDFAFCRCNTLNDYTTISMIGEYPYEQYWGCDKPN